MRILHVITGLRKAAGTSVFCGEICNELAAAGHDVTIAVCDPTAPDVYPLDPRIHLISIESVLRTNSQQLTANHFSLIHLHALWSPILHKVARWARRNRIPVVWSPHGMLTSWAMRNKWWKKWPVWHLYQKRDLESAALFHATAQSEVDDIRRMGLKNEVVVAPLGVRVGRVEGKRCRDRKTLLFVSRVQRKKGLPMLLEAWARVKKDGWRVRIVGPDQDGHTAELMALCARLGLSYMDQEGKLHCSPSPAFFTSNSTSPEVEFVGPLYGDDLTREYASADLFVLPTHSENFGSVVIESLVQGVPVICTKGAPWEELETHRCGKWVDVGVKPLAAAISELLNLSTAERRAMGESGRRLVEEKYTWHAVARSILRAYEVRKGE